MRTSLGRRHVLHDDATRDRFLEPSAIWSAGPLDLSESGV